MTDPKTPFSPTRALHQLMDAADAAQKSMLANEHEQDPDRLAANELRIDRSLLEAKQHLDAVLRARAATPGVSPFAPRGEA